MYDDGLIAEEVRATGRGGQVWVVVGGGEGGGGYITVLASKVTGLAGLGICVVAGMKLATVRRVCGNKSRIVSNDELPRIAWGVDKVE